MFFYNLNFLKFFLVKLNLTKKISKKTRIIIGFKKKKKYFFNVGDVIEIVFFRKNVPIIFEGICLSIKKKLFLSSNSSFKLRNILLGVPIELTCCFFYSRLYNFKFKDYRKKMKKIRSSKIYFIRYRLNKESRVK